MRAAHVFAPATPSTVRWCARWKATRAASVFAPKTPSAGTFAPCASSRYCSERTVILGQVLFRPGRRTGQPLGVAAAASRVVTVAVDALAAAAVDADVDADADADAGRARPAIRTPDASPLVSSAVPMVFAAVIVNVPPGFTSRGFPRLRLVMRRLTRICIDFQASNGRP